MQVHALKKKPGTNECVFWDKEHGCEIYQTAGISFDFSEDYIQSLMQFVSNELKKLA